MQTFGGDGSSVAINCDAKKDLGMSYKRPKKGDDIAKIMFFVWFCMVVWFREIHGVSRDFSWCVCED